MQYPFEKVLNQIGVDDIEMFLKKIKIKRSLYKRPAVDRKIVEPLIFEKIVDSNTSK
jgi:hypothetical protein